MFKSLKNKKDADEDVIDFLLKEESRNIELSSSEKLPPPQKKEEKETEEIKVCEKNDENDEENEKKVKNQFDELPTPPAPPKEGNGIGFKEKRARLEMMLKGMSERKEEDNRKVDMLEDQYRSGMCVDVLRMIFEFVTLDVDLFRVVDGAMDGSFVSCKWQILKRPKGKRVVNNSKRWISIVYGKYSTSRIPFLMYRSFARMQRSLTRFLPVQALSVHIYSHENETQEYLIDFEKVLSNRNCLRKVFLEETNFEPKHIDLLSKTVEELYIKSHRIIPAFSGGMKGEKRIKYLEMKEKVCSIWWPEEFNEKDRFKYFNDNIWKILTRLSRLQVLYLEYNKLISHNMMTYFNFKEATDARIIRSIGNQIKRLCLFGFSLDATILFSGESSIEEIKWDCFISIDVDKIHKFNQKLKVVDGGYFKAHRIETEECRVKWQEFKKDLKCFNEMKSDF